MTRADIPASIPFNWYRTGPWYAFRKSLLLAASGRRAAVTRRSAGMREVPYSGGVNKEWGAVIELSEMISELHQELNWAIETGHDERPRFELGPVEVEVTVGLDSRGKAGAKVRFWVVELGADEQVAVVTPAVKLTLQP